MGGSSNVITRSFKCNISITPPFEYSVKVVIRSRQQLPVVMAPARLELVEDTIVLVQIAQLGLEMIVYV